MVAKGVVATIDVVDACTDVNIAVIFCEFPRKEGMGRKHAMLKTSSINKDQASALEKHAASSCKETPNPAKEQLTMLVKSSVILRSPDGTKKLDITLDCHVSAQNLSRPFSTSPAALEKYFTPRIDSGERHVWRRRRRRMES